MVPTSTGNSMQTCKLAQIHNKQLLNVGSCGLHIVPLKGLFKLNKTSYANEFRYRMSLDIVV